MESRQFPKGIVTYLYSLECVRNPTFLALIIEIQIGLSQVYAPPTLLRARAIGWAPCTMDMSATSDVRLDEHLPSSQVNNDDDCVTEESR